MSITLLIRLLIVLGSVYVTACANDTNGYGIAGCGLERGTDRIAYIENPRPFVP